MQCRLLTSAAAVVSAVAAAMTSWPQEEASASMCSWISRTIRIRFSVLKGEWKMFFLFDLDMVHVFGQVIIWQEKDNCTNQVNQTQIYTSRCPTMYCLTSCQLNTQDEPFRWRVGSGCPSSTTRDCRGRTTSRVAGRTCRSGFSRFRG